MNKKYKIHRLLDVYLKLQNRFKCNRELLKTYIGKYESINQNKRNFIYSEKYDIGYCMYFNEYYKDTVFTRFDKNENRSYKLKSFLTKDSLLVDNIVHLISNNFTIYQEKVNILIGNYIKDLIDVKYPSRIRENKIDIIRVDDVSIIFTYRNGVLIVDKIVKDDSIIII